MNEKISELIRQSEVSISHLRAYHGHIDIEKFAELIVKECVGIADEYDGAGSTIVSRIKKHFGVEE